MDYGTLLVELKLVVRDAAAAAHKSSFGTPRYYHTLNVTVHRAFDKFASDHGIGCAEREKFLNLLKSHCIAYRIDKSTTGLTALFHTLPNEFNVRGKWTSEEFIIK